jgi:hypothetical protein
MGIKGSSHEASPDTLAGARRGDFMITGSFGFYAAKTARDHETGRRGAGGMGWGGGGMGWGGGGMGERMRGWVAT